MYTAAFRYIRPTSLAEAEKIFAAETDARYLAGGQTLIPAMKLRLAAPSALIDLARIPETAFVRVEGKTMVIGAGMRHADVAASEELRKNLPTLGELASGIGDPAVRHRGTLGGSVANNDPAADYPAALLALNATVTTTRRTIAAAEFFTGMFATALEDGEIVTSVTFPIARRAGYAKFRNPASHYAMTGVFVAETADGIRVAVTGAGPCVFRAPEMEQALQRRFAPEAVAGIRIAPDELNSDIHGSAEYRANLITVMTKRAVVQALSQ